MKKIISGILAGIIAISVSASALADGIDVIINGKPAEFDNTPFISNNRVFVPMRDLFETIGATVLWDDNAQCAVASLGDKTICFTIGSNVVTQNGDEYVSDSVCQLVGNKTFVPLRIILELLDFTVNWNGNDNKVEIETPPSSDSIENENKPVQDENQDSMISVSEYELKVLELVNIEREKNGLSALTWNSKLAEVARTHSMDMAERNFFSHTNPDGKSPFDRIKAYGISYSRAAENIAVGQSTPEEVVESWMNSEGHRANILNSSFTSLGVGYHKSNSGYKHYWTQCFTG